MWQPVGTLQGAGPMRWVMYVCSRWYKKVDKNPRLESARVNLKGTAPSEPSQGTQRYSSWCHSELLICFTLSNPHDNLLLSSVCKWGNRRRKTQCCLRLHVKQGVSSDGLTLDLCAFITVMPGWSKGLRKHGDALKDLARWPLSAEADVLT